MSVKFSRFQSQQMPPVRGIALFVDDTDDPEGILLDAIDHQIRKGFHQVAPGAGRERLAGGRVLRQPMSGGFEAFQKTASACSERSK